MHFWRFFTYTGGRNVWVGSFLAANHQNFDQSLTPKELWLNFTGLKQKKLKKNPKWPRTNTWNFQIKNLRIGHFEKNLLHPHKNQSELLGHQEWVEILMTALVSSQKLPNPNISAPSTLLLRLPCHASDIHCGAWNKLLQNRQLYTVQS